VQMTEPELESVREPRKEVKLVRALVETSEPGSVAAMEVKLVLASVKELESGKEAVMAMKLVRA